MTNKTETKHYDMTQMVTDILDVMKMYPEDEVIEILRRVKLHDELVNYLRLSRDLIASHREVLNDGFVHIDDKLAEINATLAKAEGKL